MLHGWMQDAMIQGYRAWSWGVDKKGAALRPPQTVKRTRV